VNDVAAVGIQNAYQEIPSPLHPEIHQVNVPHLVRIACLRDSPTLTRLRSLPAIEKVITVQDSVYRGRCEIDHIFIHHHPGKADIGYYNFPK